jgi:uncharacterized protein (TIGR03435 family)
MMRFAPVVWLAGLALGQGFEVATIKPAAETPVGQRPVLGLQVTGDRVEIRGLGLRFSIGQAYGVAAIYVFGEDWLDTKFDIAAKMPVGATAKEMPAMLQELLAERFGLRVHREKRQMPVFAMTVAKGGLKLKELPPDTPNGSKNTPQVMTTIGPLSAIGAAASFAGLRQPLLDQTGLTGKYEIPLDSALIFDGIRRGVVNDLDDSDALARMQQAVEPLGLKIERARVERDVVVVDHVEHAPTGN